MPYFSLSSMTYFLFYQHQKQCWKLKKNKKTTSKAGSKGRSPPSHHPPSIFIYFLHSAPTFLELGYKIKKALYLKMFAAVLPLSFYFSISLLVETAGEEKHRLTLTQSRRNSDELHTNAPSNYLDVYRRDWDSILGVTQRHWLEDLRLKVSVVQMVGGQCGAGNFNINVKQSRSHKQELFYLLWGWHFKANTWMHNYLHTHQTAPLRIWYSIDRLTVSISLLGFCSSVAWCNWRIAINSTQFIPFHNVPDLPIDYASFV